VEASKSDNKQAVFYGAIIRAARQEGNGEGSARMLLMWRVAFRKW
jgi:hypothetical protein